MFRTSLVNRCLTLLIWHKLESREDGTVEMCSVKVKFESRIIPRSLADEAGVNSWPRKGTVKCGSLETSWRVPNNTRFLFSGFINNWFAQHHPATSSRSWEIWCKHEWSSCAELDRYIFVSSTYDSILLNLVTPGRSFIYKLKNTGPRIEPWGTAWVTPMALLKSISTITVIICLLPMALKIWSVASRLKASVECSLRFPLWWLVRRFFCTKWLFNWHIAILSSTLERIGSRCELTKD